MSITKKKKKGCSAELPIIKFASSGTQMNQQS